MNYRIKKHPILRLPDNQKKIIFYLDGEKTEALQGDCIASAVIASGKKIFRYTKKNKKPRSLFCGIGQCNDCMMEVDGIPNVKTCITPVKKGMRINTQAGAGEWKK